MKSHEVVNLVRREGNRPLGGEDVFRGHFKHTVDPKGRLSIPAKFREALTDGFGDKLVIVSNGRGALDVYPERNWKDLEERVSRLPRLDSFRRTFQYQYLSKGQDVTLDPQGRIQIPLDIRESESLTKDVTIIGMQEKFEIWNAERWTHFERDKVGAPIEDVEQKLAHLPVLADEVTFLLRPRRGGWVVDGTIGMGGHAERLLEAGGTGMRLLGLDADPEALARAGQRLARFGERVTLRHGSFREIGGHAREAGIGPAATVLLDLGLSSYQLDASGRGFTFQKDEPLDMRFDPTRGRTAADQLAHATEADLARILFEYGEERHARRIAKRIVHLRQRSPLTRTAHLVEAVKAGVPRAAWSRRTHVATRTFQAIRMAVNEEPEALREALDAAPALLERGGRLGIISFHSGEDRAVKRAFRALEATGFIELVPSPVTASDPEVSGNPRARSAKLRVLKRLEAA